MMGLSPRRTVPVCFSGQLFANALLSAEVPPKRDWILPPRAVAGPATRRGAGPARRAPVQLLGLLRLAVATDPQGRFQSVCLQDLVSPCLRAVLMRDAQRLSTAVGAQLAPRNPASDAVKACSKAHADAAMALGVPAAVV